MNLSACFVNIYSEQRGQHSLKSTIVLCPLRCEYPTVGDISNIVPYNAFLFELFHDQPREITTLSGRRAEPRARYCLSHSTFAD